MTKEEKKILKDFLKALKKVKDCTDSRNVTFECFGAFDYESRACQEYASDGTRGKVICRLCRAVNSKPTAHWIPDFIELELS